MPEKCSGFILLVLVVLRLSIIVLLLLRVGLLSGCNACRTSLPGCGATQAGTAAIQVDSLPLAVSQILVQLQVELVEVLVPKVQAHFKSTTSLSKIHPASGRSVFKFQPQPDSELRKLSGSDRLGVSLRLRSSSVSVSLRLHCSASGIA
jgi:hypothetical protein